MIFEVEIIEPKMLVPGLDCISKHKIMCCTASSLATEIWPLFCLYMLRLKPPCQTQTISPHYS